jgi:hypothetical protein
MNQESNMIAAKPDLPHIPLDRLDKNQNRNSFKLISRVRANCAKL